jgi:hypothetical protein
MYRRSLLSLVTLALVGACADVPAPPTGIERVALAPSAAKGGKGTPNRIKPSDNGKKPGTGGSGSSTLELSALFGNDGATTIEASTGSLEDGTTNGTLTKVQLKLFLDSVITANFTGLTAGYWSTTDGRLVPGDTVQAKGTIKPLTGKGTDNVTVSTTVHFRPDIAVLSVEAQDPVIRDIPHVFVAVVREQNGDRGARGDCVLAIDGVDVDRATGIWVDAGTTVSCQFAHAFGTLGDHAVTVRVDNVTPGDWDTANNAATLNVNVIRPTFAVGRGRFDVHEEHSTSVFATDTQRVGASDLHHRINETHVTTVWISASDAVVRPQPFQSVFAVVLKDGVEVHRKASLPLMQSFDQTTNGTRTICLSGFDGYDQASVCTVDGPSEKATFYYYQKSNGYTVFYGNDIYCLFGFCNVYASPSGQSLIGGGHAFGYTPSSTASIHVAWNDGIGDPHVADATISTLTQTPIDSHAQGCRGPIDLEELFTFLQVCWWSDYTGFGVTGRVEW